MTFLRRGPIETTTLSLALNPRPLTLRGCLSVILNVGRSAWAAVASGAFSLNPEVSTRTSRPRSNTNQSVGNPVCTSLLPVQRTALLWVVLLTGCGFGGGGEASIQRNELEQLVLQPEDVPRIFLRFDQGRQVMADSPAGRRADPSRFGRIEGWKARYRRPGTAQTAGPLVIESRADLFDSASGAEDDFEAARMDLSDQALGWEPIDEPGLGDESFVATSAQGGLRYYLVFWRDDNATATLNVSGFEPRLPLAEVLALARKQDERLGRVAAS